MNYILTNIYPDGMPDPNSLNHEKIHQQRWKEYRNHLQTKKNKMTENLREFALADWHYDISDHRCPHDSWLENLTITEKESAEDDSGTRITDITIKLLGAYHDLYITIKYLHVKTYCFDQPRRDSAFPHTQSSHSDWLIDEIIVEGTKNYFHKIIWASGATWYIHFEDLIVTFQEIKDNKHI